VFLHSCELRKEAWFNMEISLRTVHSLRQIPHRAERKKKKEKKKITADKKEKTSKIKFILVYQSLQRRKYQN